MTDKPKDAPEPPLWVAWYAKDFIDGTLNMSVEEVGAYMLLLSFQVSRGSIPSDPVQLTRIVRMSPAQWRKCSPMILSKFTIASDGSLYNARMRDEIEASIQNRDKNRNNGSKGGRPRKPKHNPNETHGFSKQNPSGNPMGNPNETHTERDTEREVQDISRSRERAPVGAPCTEQQARAAAEQLMRPGDLGAEWWNDRNRKHWEIADHTGRLIPVTASTWRSDLSAWSSSVASSRSRTPGNRPTEQPAKPKDYSKGF